MFTSQDVMKLRQMTGVGMMDCKKALEATDGNFDEAIKFLREKGMATAAKKAGRIASEGLVLSYKNNGVCTLVEVNCETDFVARGDQFKNFVTGVAEYVANNNINTIEELVAAKTADVNEAIAKIGEKIAIRRFVKYVENNSTVDSYIHMGGKIGVVVEASKNIPAEVIHDVALQIAAAKPSYITKEEVPQDEIAKEKEILKAQALNEPNPKPVNIIEKMVEGRINKYYKDVCLLEQPFVKNGDMSIAQYLKASNASIIRFTRFEMGEGLEKKQDDMASEVQAQLDKLKK